MNLAEDVSIYGTWREGEGEVEFDVLSCQSFQDGLLLLVGIGNTQVQHLVEATGT